MAPPGDPCKSVAFANQGAEIMPSDWHSGAPAFPPAGNWGGGGRQRAPPQRATRTLDSALSCARTLALATGFSAGALGVVRPARFGGLA